MGKKFFNRLFFFLILFLLLDYALFSLFKNGLDKFYGFSKSAEILIIGSSASISGYDVDILESALDKKVALYAQEGSSLELRFIMLNHFLTSNNGSITTVLLEVSPRNFFNRGLAANSHKLFYPYIEDSVIDKYIASEETTLANYYIHKIVKTSRFNNHLIKYSFQGFVGFNKNVKTSIVDTTTIAHLNSADLEAIILDSAKVKLLEQSINLILENNARVVLVNFPVTTFLQESYSKDDYNQYLKLLQSLTHRFTSVSLIDLNVEEFNDYKLFSDRGHLNRTGQKKFTEGICSELE